MTTNPLTLLAALLPIAGLLPLFVIRLGKTATLDIPLARRSMPAIVGARARGLATTRGAATDASHVHGPLGRAA